jgi:hypothetical protein
VLGHGFTFDGPGLCQALRATFRRRQTPLPDQPPVALTPEFGADEGKKKQWVAFLSPGKLDIGGISLEQVCAFLNEYLMPPTVALAAGEEWTKDWPPGGPWGEPASR